MTMCYNNNNNKEESMDETMEDIDEALIENEIDFEYEYDACHFFDFTREETRSEFEEAESWFRFADEYPPSPFILKLKMMKAAKAKKAHKKTEADKKSSTSSVSDANTDHKATSRDVKMKDVKHRNHVPQDNVKAKSKSTVNLSKPSGSFMKPTASHLAKQNKECDTHYAGYGRLQTPLVVSAVETLRSPIRCQSQDTKRQKLDIGYLRKDAQLKHRASYLHKVTKKSAHLEGVLNSRVKTTVPQKPALLTEERVQRHRSQNKSGYVQQPKENDAFGAPPLNKKILDAPKLPQREKSMTRLTGFQDVHMKTADRAIQVEYTNAHSQVLHKQNSASLMGQDVCKSQKSADVVMKDKYKSPKNLKSCTSDKLMAQVHPIKDGCVLNAKHNSHQPPIELFRKLSLKSESETKDISSPRTLRLDKGLKENVPRSFQPDYRRCAGKPNHCGTDRRFTEVKI